MSLIQTADSNDVAEDALGSKSLSEGAKKIAIDVVKAFIPGSGIYDATLLNKEREKLNNYKLEESK